jgi:hypothetical protein
MSSKVKRRLVFALSAVLAMGLVSELSRLHFLNTTGRQEADRALKLHDDLADQIGARRYGFAWRGWHEWWIWHRGAAEMRIPVKGTGVSGTLYLREIDQPAGWKLLELRFRETGSDEWKTYWRDSGS